LDVYADAPSFFDFARYAEAIGHRRKWERGFTMVTFGRVTPSIYVQDIQRSLEFYRDILGFSVVFTNGSPVSFAVLKQDVAHIHLCVRPESAGSCHAHVMLSGLDSLYDRLIGAGIMVHQAPKVQPWGLRDIVVADRDGNTFEFAELSA
jgi:catechol 2,3-dioxygenase-like lactoylglutathione lyase family enzyme